MPMDRSCQQYFDAFSQTPSGELRSEYYNPFTVRHRKKTTKTQLEILEKTFETNIRPDTRLRKMLAEQLEMTPRSIQVWFQNRRAKEKKMAEKRFKRHNCNANVDSVSIQSLHSFTSFYFSATNNRLFEPPVSVDVRSPMYYYQNFSPTSSSLGAMTSSQEYYGREANARLLDADQRLLFEKGTSRCE